MSIKQIVFTFILLFPFISYADTNTTKIIADSFTADEIQQFTHFKGNVKVFQNNDELYAQSVYVKFDQHKKPLHYILKGDVRFKLHTQDKLYKGKGQSVIIDPIKEIVVIEKDAYLEDNTTGQKVYGEKIRFNRTSGVSSVFGQENKPVTFIINQNKK